MSTAGLTIEGALELKALMDQLSRKQIRQISHKAVQAAAVPLLNTMRQLAHVGETGGIRASLAIKSRLYKRGTTAVAIVGPRSDFATESPYSKKYQHKPSKIAHLIEGGHRIVLKSGDTGKRTRSFPFVAPAAQQSEAASMRILASELSAGIQQVWAGEYAGIVD